MERLEELYKFINTLHSSGNYSIFDNIPESELKSEKDRNILTGIAYKNLKKTGCFKCLYPGCNNYPISSHSIQKALLKKIADNNQLINLKMKAEFKLNGKITCIDKPVHVDDASTFEGYCNPHDTQVFLPIESKQIIETDDEQLFLLLYRSIVREYFENRKSYKIQQNTTASMFKNRDEELLQAFAVIEQYKSFCEFFRIEKLKEAFDVLYENKKFETPFEVIHLKINEFIPVLVNTFFCVQGAYEDILYQQDITKDYPYFCSLQILLSEQNKLDLYFFYLKEQKKELHAFINRFQNPETNEFKIFLSDTILRNSDNFFISPNYWNNYFTQSKRDKIKNFFYRTILDRSYDLSTNINLWEKD